MGVHVEREAGLHPHLPLQPGHRAQGRSARQTAPAEQGIYEKIVFTPISFGSDFWAF